jgi:hypothetical protein
MNGLSGGFEVFDNEINPFLAEVLGCLQGIDKINHISA